MTTTKEIDDITLGDAIKAVNSGIGLGNIKAEQALHRSGLLIYEERQLHPRSTPDNGVKGRIHAKRLQVLRHQCRCAIAAQDIETKEQHRQRRLNQNWSVNRG